MQVQERFYFIPRDVRKVQTTKYNKLEEID